MHQEVPGTEEDEESIDIKPFRSLNEVRTEVRALQKKGEHTAYEFTFEDGRKIYAFDYSSTSGFDGDEAIVRINIKEILNLSDDIKVTAVLHSHSISEYATGYDLDVFDAFPHLNRIEVIFGANNQASIYYRQNIGNWNIVDGDIVDKKLSTYKYDQIENF